MALRTTRRSSSLSLSEEPIRKRLAPFLWLDPLLLLLLLLSLPESLLLPEPLEEPELLPESARGGGGGQRRWVSTGIVAPSILTCHAQTASSISDKHLRSRHSQSST